MKKQKKRTILFMILFPVIYFSLILFVHYSHLFYYDLNNPYPGMAFFSNLSRMIYMVNPAAFLFFVDDDSSLFAFLFWILGIIFWALIGYAASKIRLKK